MRPRFWGSGLARSIARPAVSLGVAAVMAVTGISLTGYVGSLLEEARLDRLEHDTMTRLSELRARLEGELNTALYIARAVASFAAVNDRLSPGAFRGFAEEISALQGGVRRVMLAPGNVVRFVYPLFGNVVELGRDYAAAPAEREAVTRAAHLRVALVHGPGNGRDRRRELTVFAPVLRRVEGEVTRLDRVPDGVAAVVVDFERMLDTAGLNETDGTYSLALRGAATGARPGDLLFGDGALFDDGAQSLPVRLAAGPWEIAALPEPGAGPGGREGMFARMIGYGVTALLVVLSAFAVNSQMRVRSIALHDPLTGLPNRRLLEARLQRLAARADRKNREFELFFIDLDGFKPINDTHGHAVGDLLLREIGRRLRANTRRSDTVARVGGDEFVVVMPAPLGDGFVVGIADRLRQAVSMPFEVSGVTILVRASVGSARFPSDADSVRDLLELADRRMYAEKMAAA